MKTLHRTLVFGAKPLTEGQDILDTMKSFTVKKSNLVPCTQCVTVDDHSMRCQATHWTPRDQVHPSIQFSPHSTCKFEYSSLKRRKLNLPMVFPSFRSYEQRRGKCQLAYTTLTLMRKAYTLFGEVQTDNRIRFWHNGLVGQSQMTQQLWD